jgi:hypothetical protein
VKNPQSLLIGIDIPNGFKVEVMTEGFAIFKGRKRLAIVKTLRGLRIALEYFSREKNQ